MGLLEPLDGVGLVEAVGVANATGLDLLVVDALTAAAEDDEEVHTVDTDGGVVLDAEIDVLVDAEAEGAVVGEVEAAELELLHLEALDKDLVGLVATDGSVAGDLLVTTDTEGTDGQAGAGEDGGLTAELLNDTAGADEAITRFTDAAVDGELLDEDLAHGVGVLLGGTFCLLGGNHVRYC